MIKFPILTMPNCSHIYTSAIKPNGIKDSIVQPFLKWPGGKRWLVPELMNIIGEYNYKTYREPFLGGGAVFFALRPKQSVLSDINSDLINTYRQVKYESRFLIEQLKLLPVDHETYYQIRSSNPKSAIQKAVRFLYLNRTAFGGMYRLNQQGEFNVPFGGGDRTTNPLWKNDLVTISARVLRKAKLVVSDFEQSISAAERGDFLYCDPTYTVAHNNNGFIRYNERNFSWDDQKRLALSCHEAARKGVMVVVSNACHGKVLDLFAPPQYRIVTRTSRLCPEIVHRKRVEEFIFVYPPQ